MKRCSRDLQPWLHTPDPYHSLWTRKNVRIRLIDIEQDEKCPHDLQPWLHTPILMHSLWTGKYIEQDEKMSSWPPTLVISSRLWLQPSDLENILNKVKNVLMTSNLGSILQSWPQSLNWKIYWTRWKDLLMTSNLGHLHQILTTASEQENILN